MIPLKEPNQDFIIEINNLTKRFGQLVAVDHISFKVKQGELFGFLGPNGAGKTTTVRILTGVIKADEGNAFISRYSTGSLKAKEVAGVVPEMSNAYPDLSGWDNLMLMCELYGITAGKAQERSKIQITIINPDWTAVEFPGIIGHWGIYAGFVNPQNDGAK